MSRKALLAGLIKQNPSLPGELAKVAVAADLAILVAESGISRSDLAKKLGWTRARVSQVLSGEGNLTIETMHAVAKAAGSSFDVVFRKPAAVRALQPWQQNAALQLQMGDEPDLQSWMSRKTMTPMHSPSLKQTPKQRQFAGAHEFVLRGMTFDSSNHDYMSGEVACAA